MNVLHFVDLKLCTSQDIMLLAEIGVDVDVMFCMMCQMFNSRTCQLVLGAGALHLVGLKNINTKNLGLLHFTG